MRLHVSSPPGKSATVINRSSRFYPLSEPMFDPIRGSARFRRVLEHLGLSATADRADRIRVERASRTDHS
jgi:hypothetical protein